MSSLRFVFGGFGIALAAGWAALAACGPEPTTGFVDAADRPDGGLYLTPLQVTCGSLDCSLTVGGCCAGPSVPFTCLDAGMTCPANAGLVACNEEADCVHGEICCATLVAGSGAAEAGAGYLSATCATSCPAPQIQLCRTNGECSGDRCVIQTCPAKQTYEMCGLSPSAAFPCTTSLAAAAGADGDAGSGGDGGQD